MSSIVSALDAHPESIRKTVQTLVKKGYLKKLGATRGARYALTETSS